MKKDILSVGSCTLWSFDFCPEREREGRMDGGRERQEGRTEGGRERRETERQTEGQTGDTRPSR